MAIDFPAVAIARQILDGFDYYREEFRKITNLGRERFEKAQWQEIQDASAGRIQLYKVRVELTQKLLIKQYGKDVLLNIKCWPQIKKSYIGQIDLRLDDELSETWFNSIFNSLFSHDLISDECMFVHSTRPALSEHDAPMQIRTYRPHGDLSGTLRQISEDYRFSVPYENQKRDLKRLEKQLRSHLPDWVCKDPELCIELYSSRLYRNKGAYLVGRVFTQDEQWPLVMPFLNREGKGIRMDAVIVDEAEVVVESNDTEITEITDYH